MWTGFIRFTTESVASSSEHINEHSVSVKAWEFIDRLSYYNLFKYSTPDYEARVLPLHCVRYSFPLAFLRF
jgi:hypothetical protein